MVMNDFETMQSSSPDKSSNMSAVKSFAPNRRFQDMQLPGSTNLGVMKQIVAFDTLMDQKNSSGSSLIDKTAGANMFSIQAQRGMEQDETMNDGEDSDLCSP